MLKYMIFAEDVNGIQRIERNTLIMNNDEKEIKLESIENHGCNDKIEEFIVVQNAGLDSEEIYYTGFSEIEAYRTYKRIKGGKKNIFKAYIKRDLVFNVPFIDTYEIIEVIR